MTDHPTGRQAIFDRIVDDAVIGIVRAPAAERARCLVAALADAGLGVVEVAMTTPGALDVVAEAATTGLIGAGTVRTVAHARDAIAAGARFLVSPNLDTDVVRYAVERDIACVPGCATPTEMVTAIDAGAVAVKMFPAHLWTPAALAGMLQALPDLPCVPTGGVTAATAPDWIAAGAVAVGVGACLTRAADPRAEVTSLRQRIDRIRHETHRAPTTPE
jgi:2-dehydro-3-deoxyphosphogluconate aldolase/(4S)-4-hydroxy-2-oxoglutarate aldolase